VLAAQDSDDVFVVLVGVGLQMRAGRMVIPDVEKTFAAEAADFFRGLVADSSSALGGAGAT
jgi:hypothetical protein